MISLISIKPEDPYSKDAVRLMEELSDSLTAITGDSGKSSFDAKDVCGSRAIFVIARDQNGEAVGCGAFRPIDSTTVEVKRMYAKAKGCGVGTQLLAYLEAQAKQMNYSAVRLETRLVNSRAVRFYEQNGYSRIPNYGRYINNDRAVCFEKGI